MHTVMVCIPKCRSRLCLNFREIVFETSHLCEKILIVECGGGGKKSAQIITLNIGHCKILKVPANDFENKLRFIIVAYH